MLLYCLLKKGDIILKNKPIKRFIFIILISRTIVIGDPISYCIQMFITTSKTDDRHLRVAMQALNRLRDLEENGDNITFEEEMVYEKLKCMTYDIFDNSEELSDEEFVRYERIMDEIEVQKEYEKELFMSIFTK